MSTFTIEESNIASQNYNILSSKEGKQEDIIIVDITANQSWGWALEYNKSIIRKRESKRESITSSQSKSPISNSEPNSSIRNPNFIISSKTFTSKLIKTNKRNKSNNFSSLFIQECKSITNILNSYSTCYSTNINTITIFITIIKCYFSWSTKWYL